MLSLLRLNSAWEGLVGMVKAEDARLSQAKAQAEYNQMTTDVKVGSFNIFPTLGIIFPRLVLFSHAWYYFLTLGIIFSRLALFSHAWYYFLTLGIIFPCLILFSHALFYFSTLSIIFPR